MHSTLAAHDIAFHLSCSYTSPQNYKAEHILRTLNNLVHTLLIQASMPPKYWGPSPQLRICLTATHLHPLTTSFPTTIFLFHWQLMSIFVSSTVCVILTCKPPHRISLHLVRQHVYSLGIRPRTRGTAVLISSPNGLSYHDTSSLMSLFFCLQAVDG
jgi:hypothetical protein